MEDIFKDPSSISCVHRINEIAKENWSGFILTHSVKMDSHLIPYPIVIDKDGNITAHAEGFFPDTKAPILGACSLPLPDLLAT
jgi:phospholipase D1/2